MSSTKRNRFVTWGLPLGLLAAGFGANCGGNGGDTGGFGGSGDSSTSGVVNGANQGTATVGQGTTATGAGVATTGGVTTTGQGVTSTGVGATTTGAGPTTTTSGVTTTGAGGATATTAAGTTTTVGATTTTGAGGAFTGANPPGYYSTKDWAVTSVDWHGCVWTGKDSTVAGSTTSITPQDFTAASKEGGPYEVNGTVYNDYNAVALLGFNLNEATTASSTQCKYNAAASTQTGPPAGTIPSSATGYRRELEREDSAADLVPHPDPGADGATNADDRWCATITDAQGPSFIPFTQLLHPVLECGTTTSPGTQYTGNEPIDAVVFLVPGTMQKLRPSTSRSSASRRAPARATRPGGTAACGTITGTLGSTTASMAASYRPRGRDRHGLQGIHHPEQQLGQSRPVAPSSSTTPEPASPFRAAAARAAAHRHPSPPPT